MHTWPPRRHRSGRRPHYVQELPDRLRLRRAHYQRRPAPLVGCTPTSPEAPNPAAGTPSLTIYPYPAVTAVVLSNYSLAAIGDTSAFLAHQYRIITQHTW